MLDKSISHMYKGEFCIINVERCTCLSGVESDSQIQLGTTDLTLPY